MFFHMRYLLFVTISDHYAAIDDLISWYLAHHYYVTISRITFETIAIQCQLWCKNLQPVANNLYKKA